MISGHGPSLRGEDIFMDLSNWVVRRGTQRAGCTLVRAIRALAGSRSWPTYSPRILKHTYFSTKLSLPTALILLNLFRMNSSWGTAHRVGGRLGRVWKPT
jgi:hypothetical protein